MTIRRYLREGERLPICYGFAWRSYSDGFIVAYPIPLSLIFRWLRALWFKAIQLAPETGWEKQLAAARWESYHQGYKAGYDRGMQIRDKVVDLMLVRNIDKGV